MEVEVQDRGPAAYVEEWAALAIGGAGGLEPIG
jgi:hypothetical protein